ncbi:MAG: FAD binding domain-containing protein [Actinomycetota bacterium]
MTQADAHAEEMILNGSPLPVPDPGTNLLDLIRQTAGLTGTKPACRGGDCGACLVLLGEVPPGATEPRYLPVNTCLLTAGRAIGCHVITVEGLTARADAAAPPRTPGGTPTAPPFPSVPLTPVQRALVEHGGVQCGYCTPGFVMALTGALFAGTSLLDSVDGNLCRCTGYAGIRRACAALEAQFPRRPLTLTEAAAAGLLPAAIADAATSLTPLPPEPLGPGGVIGGETDWGVQHPYESGITATRLHRVPELRAITADGEWIAIGAAVTVAELKNSELVAAAWPTLPEFLELFASPAIRASATVGGNLANASPAADLAVVLLALGAEVEITGPDGERTLPLEEFNLGYKTTALKPGEVIARVRIPGNADGTRRLHTIKVSKRPHDDITSVTSAVVGQVGSTSHGEVRLAAGGVAPVPLLLRETASALAGAPVDVETVRAAVATARAEATPIDDLRGSATYKRALLGNQVIAHLDALFPGTIDWREALR